MPLDLAGYLRMAQGQTIPPLLLELVLRSGRSYFVKNVFSPFHADGLFPLRVWDLRALKDSDYPTLTKLLSTTRDRGAWSDYRTFFPQLDEGNLWLCAAEVEHIMEWHDRLWPDEERQSSDSGPSQARPIGFRYPQEAADVR